MWQQKNIKLELGRRTLEIKGYNQTERRREEKEMRREIKSIWQQSKRERERKREIKKIEKYQEVRNGGKKVRVRMGVEGEGKLEREKVECDRQHKIEVARLQPENEDILSSDWKLVFIPKFHNKDLPKIFALFELCLQVKLRGFNHVFLEQILEIMTQ